MRILSEFIELFSDEIFIIEVLFSVVFKTGAGGGAGLDAGDDAGDYAGQEPQSTLQEEQDSPLLQEPSPQ